MGEVTHMLEIIREYDDEVVMSSNGDALVVRWTLKLNGVEVGRTRELFPCSYDRSNIGDPPGLTTLRDQIKMGLAAAVSGNTETEGLTSAAEFIEAHEILDSSDGQSVRPRSEGNRAGLAYAVALRGLIASSSQDVAE